MVAPKYGPTGASSPSETSQGSASRSSEKRREQVLQRLIEQAGESRSEGNSLFKHQSYAEAEIKYSKAIHTLQKIPGELAGPDLVKSLNNRSRVYVKLDKMELAEADASEVGSQVNAARTNGHLMPSPAHVKQTYKTLDLPLSWRHSDLFSQQVQDMKARLQKGEVSIAPVRTRYDTTVLSMNSVENTATSAAHLVRYHARIGLGAREDALRDLKNSADLGNADAKRLLLSQARKKKAGDGNAALTKTTTSSNNNGGATVSRPSAGGCGGANSSVRGAAATSTCAAAATAGAAGAAGAGAAAAAAGRRVRGAAGAAAARTGGGGNPVRLEARLEARAGAELTFGGTSEDSRRSWLPTEAGSGGGGDGIDKSGGAGGTSSGGSSCGGDSSAEDGVVTARVETPRRRRPRPWPGGSPGSGNPGMGKNGTAAEREEESDTYPAPLPALGGPAVRRCYGPDGGSEVDAADVASTLEAGDAAGDGDACIGAQGEDADKGDGSDKQGGDAQTVAAVPEAGAGVGFEIGEAPPPEAQAQLIRWLVAQEKEKKDCEGNIWAVLDKKWWQRWQLYTGCDEHAHAVGEARSGTVENPAGGAAAAAASAADDAAPAGCGIGVADAAGDAAADSSADGVAADTADGAAAGSGGAVAAGSADDAAADAAGATDAADASGSKAGVASSSATAGTTGLPAPAPRAANTETTGAAQPTADADADQATADPDAEAAATAAAAAAAGPDPDGTLAEGTGAGPAADLDSSPVEEEEAPPRGGTATVTEENGDGGGLQATAAGEDENTEEVGGDANIVPHPASAGSGAAMGDGDGGEGPVEKDGEAGTNGHQKTAPQRVEPPAAHPGPIDNSELVLDAGTPGTIPGTGRRLRLRLVRGYHFVLVPQEAWIALHAWYGGGPALPRALVPIRDSDSGRVVFEPQLFPEFSRLDPVLRSATVCSSSVVGDNDAPSNEDLANDKPTANGDPISNGPIANGSPVEESPLVAAAAAAAAADSKEDTGGSVDGKGVGNGVGGESTEPPPAPTEEAPPAPPAAVAEGAQDGGDDGSSTGGGVQVDRAGGRGEGKGDGSADKKTKKNEDAWYPCAACGAPSNKKCTSCSKTQHRVSYCSPACQKAHWRFHKKFCGGKGSGAGLSLAKRGKAGLDNLGNTCFLNSAVQCLSHVQPLTRHVLSNAFQEDLNLTNPLGTGGRLVQAYEQVLKELWFGSGSSVSPSGLKSAIAKFAPQFNGYSQQDSQEVLSFLLDGLHEDLNRVLKKPYLTLPDGECGRPDSIIAAESWEMFGMRDKSVLVESLYGQFKSTLECQQCGKLSRKFDEFNVMPVELLDGQRLQVILDFAPLLNPSAAPTAAKAAAGDDGKGVGNLSAAMLLGGPGVEGRKPRRVAVLVPKESLVADVKAELAVMFDIGVDEMVIVVSPVSGQPFLRILPDSAQILPFTQGGYEITAHECVPGQRHALVVNRVFDGGRHVSSPEGPRAINPLPQWAQEVSALSRLRGNDRDAPFLLSFPEDVSCLGLLEIVWDYMRDFLHLTKQEYDDVHLGHTLASAGHIKVSEASEFLSPMVVQYDQRQMQWQDRLDAHNGVVVSDLGRFIPPTDAVRAADVLDLCGGRVQDLDILRLEWSGFLLDNLNESRVHHQCFGEDNHNSVQDTALRAKRVSLQDCLQKFSVPETLCEDNSWYCSRCKELRQAVKTIQVWSLPEVLILHFKRFSHAGPNRGKVELFVDFPINGLDMSPYCRGETLEGGRPMSALYDLFAVSNHMGGMGHGHYTAFVRDWEGSGMSQDWHVCDDHDCRPVPEARVRTAHAYVLFYRRRPLA